MRMFLLSLLIVARAFAAGHDSGAPDGRVERQAVCEFSDDGKGVELDRRSLLELALSHAQEIADANPRASLAELQAKLTPLTNGQVRDRQVRRFVSLSDGVDKAFDELRAASVSLIQEIREAKTVLPQEEARKVDLDLADILRDGRSRKGRLSTSFCLTLMSMPVFQIGYMTALASLPEVKAARASIEEERARLRSAGFAVSRRIQTRRREIMQLLAASLSDLPASERDERVQTFLENDTQLSELDREQVELLDKGDELEERLKLLPALRMGEMATLAPVWLGWLRSAKRARTPAEGAVAEYLAKNGEFKKVLEQLARLQNACDQLTALNNSAPAAIAAEAQRIEAGEKLERERVATIASAPRYDLAVALSVMRDPQTGGWRVLGAEAMKGQRRGGYSGIGLGLHLHAEDDLPVEEKAAAQKAAAAFLEKPESAGNLALMCR